MKKTNRNYLGIQANLMNLNNLQSSHGIQYNVRFWRFFQFSHRKILTCLQHSENDTKRQHAIDVCQVHD